MEPGTLSQATTYEKDHGRRSAQRHFPQSSSASRRTAAASGYVKTVGRTLESRKDGSRTGLSATDAYAAAGDARRVRLSRQTRMRLWRRPARSRGTGNVVLHSCDVAPTRQTTTMDANSGKPWSKMDISDLRNEIAHGRTVAQTASFLCRDEDEVREKMKELGLVERPRKEKPRRSEVGEDSSRAR